MNTTKIGLVIAVTAVMVAVALAPILLSQAFAVKTHSCTNGGGQTKNCSSPSVKHETCTAGSKDQDHPHC